MPRKFNLSENCGNCKHRNDALTKHLKEQGFIICYYHKEHPLMLSHEHCTKWESKIPQPTQLKLF